MGFFFVHSLEKEELMLKRPITYTDFDDVEHTEDFYFNLTRAEILEMMVEPDEGLDKWLENIIAAKNNRAILAEFKKIISTAYGQKSPDGKSFVKSPEMSHAFMQTAAYDALFTDLTTNEESAAVFIMGVLPKDMAKQVEETERKAAATASQPTS